MMHTAILEPPSLSRTLEPAGRAKNPWVSDHVLMTLSVWWVRNTQPLALDFTGEVATVFDSLQRDLQ
jgi:hypothetical protein